MEAPIQRFHRTAGYATRTVKRKSVGRQVAELERESEAGSTHGERAKGRQTSKRRNLYVY